MRRKRRENEKKERGKVGTALRDRTKSARGCLESTGWKSGCYEHNGRAGIHRTRHYVTTRGKEVRGATARKDIEQPGLVVPFNTFEGDEKSFPKLRASFLVQITGFEPLSTDKSFALRNLKCKIKTVCFHRLFINFNF